MISKNVLVSTYYVNVTTLIEFKNSFESGVW